MNYDHTKWQRRGRTSRIVVVLRSTAIFGTLLWFIIILMRWLIDSSFFKSFDFWNWYAVAFILLLVYGAQWWVVHLLGYSVFYAGDPIYEKLRRHGWSPFWDQIGWPFNPDSELTKRTGLAEPTYTTFVPPDEWMAQCPVCGARLPNEDQQICWNCNYGADGDNSAFYERWPHERPAPNIAPETYQSIPRAKKKRKKQQGNGQASGPYVPIDFQP